MDDDENLEPLDPRIQNELERLNKASLLINRLENDLDDSRAKFRNLLTESTQQLDCLSKKLGSCIERAKPYYDCRLKAKEVQTLTHQAATKYERAMSMQTAAREMVELAEQGYESKKPSFDTAWQEMLNHATMKVMDAENERMLSEVEHERMMQEYTQVQEEVTQEYKDHKRSIVKSKIYYEMKANFHTGLDTQKQSIEGLQTDVDAAKKLYSKALSNLEGISEEIHTRRKESAASRTLGEREAGVGSESPIPPPCDTKRASVYNNNDKTEAEIIISFPPAVPRAKHSTGKTIKAEGADTPLDLSGIHIDVISSAVKTPAITVDDVDIEKVSSHKPTNEITENISTTNEQPKKISNDKDLANQLTNETKDLSAASSKETSPVALRHRGLSGSIKLSAKQLLHETSSIDSDSGSVSSFVALDDNRVVSAMDDGYFSQSFEAELRKSIHEDYSVLPVSLARYQKPYDTARRSIGSFPPLDDVELKLDEVLKLLEITDDESIV